MLAQFALETFERVVGTRFSVRIGADERIEVTLASALGIGESVNLSDRATSFSLVFRGPEQPRLRQATYEFSHDSLGTFPLFIVPIGHDSDGSILEAVFSRIE